MTRGISEATDERGVTHHVRGLIRFVHLPKGRRRKNPAKQGHYVTQDGCRWWCTGEPVQANSPATPGRAVDCMSCLVNPPEQPQPRPKRYEDLIITSMPSGLEMKIFNVNTRPTRSITTGRRVGRRR